MLASLGSRPDVETVGEILDHVTETESARYARAASDAVHALAGDAVRPALPPEDPAPTEDVEPMCDEALARADARWQPQLREVARLDRAAHSAQAQCDADAAAAWARVLADLAARVLPVTTPPFIAGMAQSPDAYVVLTTLLLDLFPGEALGGAPAHVDEPVGVLRDGGDREGARAAA